MMSHSFSHGFAFLLAANLVSLRAGDGIRTRDVQLGKLAFYP